MLPPSFFHVLKLAHAGFAGFLLFFVLCYVKLSGIWSKRGTGHPNAWSEELRQPRTENFLSQYPHKNSEKSGTPSLILKLIFKMLLSKFMELQKLSLLACNYLAFQWNCCISHSQVSERHRGLSPTITYLKTHRNKVMPLCSMHLSVPGLDSTHQNVPASSS